MEMGPCFLRKSVKADFENEVANAYPQTLISFPWDGHWQKLWDGHACRLYIFWGGDRTYLFWVGQQASNFCSSSL